MPTGPGAATTASASSRPEAAGEDRQPAEQPSIGLVEQLVAPVDRAAQRALAIGSIDCRNLQQVETSFEPVQQLGRRQQLQARRGKLERQRQTVQPRQMATTASMLAAVSSKSGRTAFARSTNSAATRTGPPWSLDGGAGLQQASGGTWYSCSPLTCSTARLVTSSCRRSATLEQDRQRSLRLAAPARSCPARAALRVRRQPADESLDRRLGRPPPP